MDYPINLFLFLFISPNRPINHSLFDSLTLPFHSPNKLYTIKSDIIAIASAKINAIIIEISILGAAEGFRPNALALAYPTAAITAAGPKVLISITKMIVKVFITS